MELVDQLLALRAAGYSQARIAKATGVAQPTISRILTGRHKDVLASTAKRIDALHRAICLEGQEDAA
jgi:transcriptional regulator with XRE-family HTH domain